jgi:hypothetical protein
MAVLGAAWTRATAGSNGAKIPAPHALMAVFTDNYLTAITPGGDPYVVDKAVPGVAIELEGKGGLKDRLTADMLDLTGMSISPETVRTALSIIRGRSARLPPVPVSLRTARLSDGRIAVDLGRSDGAAVLAGPGGWWITGQDLATFRRSDLIAELPVPVRTAEGAMPALDLINLRSDNAKAVYMACRLMACMPGCTLPVEIFTGQPGTAKTGTTRMTVRWLGGKMTQMPKDLKDWATIAGQSHCLGHDNVSALSAERSDLICRAASGDSWAARTLYTDLGLTVLTFQPVSIIFNTVETAMRGDLVRRAVLHELVPPWRYLGDAELALAWERAHPAALGWLFDTLCTVLAMLPNIAAPQGETMPDFARVLMACDAMWGTQSLAAWKAGQGQGYADLIDDDVVAWYITDRIRQPWEGTAQDLLLLLMLPQLSGREWTPRLVSSRLDRSRAALEASGWTIQRPLDGHTKRRKIRLVPPGMAPGRW